MTQICCKNWLLFGLLIFSVVALPGQTDSLNLNFENWKPESLMSDSVSFAHGALIPVQNPYKGKLENWTSHGLGIHRTTDSFSGNYAVLVHQWYSLVPGVLHLGACQLLSMWDKKRCKCRVGAPIGKLAGYYKFFPDSDSSFAECQIVYWMGTTSQGQMDTILMATYHFQPAQTFTYFEIPVDPKGEQGTPDSISVLFLAQNKASGPNLGPIICSGGDYSMCNFLYLDDLRFLPATSHLTEPGELQGWKIYPNPTSGRLYLGDLQLENLDSIMVFDLLGRSLLQLTGEDLRSGMLDVSALPKGCFALTMVWKDGKKKVQIIVVE